MIKTISYALKPTDNTQHITSIGYDVGFALCRLTSAANVGMQYDDKKRIITFKIMPGRGARIDNYKALEVVRELEKHGEVAQVI